jgi:hypothetical protein
MLRVGMHVCTYGCAYVCMYDATWYANTSESQIRERNFITRGNYILYMFNLIYHISSGRPVISQQELKLC